MGRVHFHCPRGAGVGCVVGMGWGGHSFCQSQKGCAALYTPFVTSRTPSGWVFKCQTYSCWVSFFYLSHSLWIIFVKFSYLATLLGSFFFKFDTPVGVKIHTADTPVGVKIPSTDPSPLPVSG